MKTKNSQFIAASAMAPDENCHAGTAGRSIPTAGGVERLILPPAQGSGAAFCWAPPSNYAGGLKVTFHGHKDNLGTGNVVPFVACKVIALDAQFATPENATQASAAVAVNEAFIYEEVRAELVPSIEGTWTDGDILTFWIGRLETGDTYADTLYLVGAKLEYDIDL